MSYKEIILLITTISHRESVLCPKWKGRDNSNKKEIDALARLYPRAGRGLRRVREFAKRALPAAVQFAPRGKRRAVSLSCSGTGYTAARALRLFNPRCQFF